MRRRAAYAGVAALVALCVCGVLAPWWGVGALAHAVDGALVATSGHDLQVSSAYGLVAEDLAAIEAVEGVAAVEPVRMAYEVGDGSAAESDACAYVMPVAGAYDPTGIGATGLLAGVAYEDDSTFSAWPDEGTWSAALVSCEGGEEAASQVAERIRAAGEARAQARYEELAATAAEDVAAAKEQVDTAQAELDESTASIADSERNVEQGEAELAATRQTIVTQTASLVSLKDAYARSQAEAARALAEPKKQLDEAQKAKDELQKTYDEAMKAYSEARERPGARDTDVVTIGTDRVKLSDAPAKFEELSKRLDELTKAYDEKKKAYDETNAPFEAQTRSYEAQIASTEQLVASTRALIEQKDAALSGQRASLDNGRHTVRTRTQALETAEARLEAATEAADGLARVPWTVAGRADTVGMRMVARMGASLGRWAVVLGMLVALGVVGCGVLGRDAGTRGLALAGVVGAGVGCVGAALLAPVVARPWAARLALEVPDAFARPLDVVVSLAGGVVAVLVAARAASWRVMRAEAREGRPSRLPASWQVRLAAWRSDGSGVFSLCVVLALAVVLLVGGIVAGRSWRSGVVPSFDALVALDARSDDAAGLATQAFEGAGARVAPVCLLAVDAGEGEARFATRAVVSLNDDWFGELFPLPDGEAAPDLGSDGVWISDELARVVGVREGDALRVRLVRGDECEVAVLGTFAQASRGVDVVMGRDAFADAFGCEPTVNALLIDSAGNGLGDVRNPLWAVEG